MPKLRPLRKPEDIAAVPADKPVVIDVSDEVTAVEVAEPETPVVTRAEPAPAPAPEPEPEDDNPLATQLAEMTRAEAAQRQRADAERSRADSALREGREREAELVRERGGREQAEYDAVVNALGAAQAEADSAERDLEAAHAGQDFKGAAAAQRRLSTASARLVQLEDGKAAIDVRRERAKTAPIVPAPESTEARIDRLPLSSRQRGWLKSHPDAFTDQRRNVRLGVAHEDAIDAGHAEDSDAYYQFIEEKLGYRKPAAPAREPEPEPDAQRHETHRRSPPVSAPVSRDTPNLTTGRSRPREVTLTPAQREAAKISGVDELTYARNVLKLEQMKRDGHYPDR